MGVDKMGVDEMGTYPRGSFIAAIYNYFEVRIRSTKRLHQLQD